MVRVNFELARRAAKNVPTIYCWLAINSHILSYSLSISIWERVGMGNLYTISIVHSYVTKTAILVNQVKCVSQGRLLNIHLCAHIVIAITHSYRCLSEFNRNLVRCRSGRIIITSFASDRAKWFNLNLILHDSNLLDIVWQVKRTVRTLYIVCHTIYIFFSVGWKFELADGPRRVS